MNLKRIAPIAVAILGVILIIFAIRSCGRISDAKSTVHSISSHMSNSRMGKMATSEMEREAGQYDTKVKIILILGILFVIGGGGAMYYYRKRH